MARTKEQAKEFAQLVHRMVKSNDDLIYRFGNFGSDDFEEGIPMAEKMLRAFSAGGATIDVDIEIVGFNASNPTDIISLEHAAELGKKGAYVETYRQNLEPWRPVVYVHNRFEY